MSNAAEPAAFVEDRAAAARLACQGGANGPRLASRTCDRSGARARPGAARPEHERWRMAQSPAYPATDLDEAIARSAETTLEALSRAREAIHGVIFGQEKVVDLALVTILAGGHGLLVGVPGLAKTKLVDTLGTVLGLDARRVQFTPDLMPSDILGSEILEESADRRRHFRFVKGPIFAQLLMADEINRASPRTQSALLQAMQEHHVSVGGERHDLPRPFHVLATQNPIEQEGTYPLPEAQLDRFLLEIDVGYPDRVAERRILIETTGADEARPVPALSGEELMNAQRLARRLPVGESVVEAILDLVRSARPGEGDASVTDKLLWGPGPRASQALMFAVRARALIEGRLSPSVEDVVALAEPVLKHRMALSFAARADGETVPALVKRLVARLQG
ncbi:ATPase AAA [Salinarimonas ramus]|uniref:ATPase AAA n=2 Tax=Salinarimonas ramus TaxID=690164 RepID=A0A917V4Q5_9HYPH|nr:ATPase AAA [Salinarimonas ramus]